MTRSARSRSKMRLQAFRKAFSHRSREKLAPSAPRDVPRAPRWLQERFKIAYERAKIAQERANIAQERAKIAQERAKFAQASATIAPRAILSDFSSISASLGAFQERPRSDLSSIFVAYVRWFARASVAAFGRLFVRLFARSRRSLARSFVFCPFGWSIWS